MYFNIENLPSPGEGNGYQLQYSCLENSMDKGPGGLQSMASKRVGHDLATNTHTQVSQVGRISNLI